MTFLVPQPGRAIPGDGNPLLRLAFLTSNRRNGPCPGMNADRASATYRHEYPKHLARRLAQSSAPRKLARCLVARNLGAAAHLTHAARLGTHDGSLKGTHCATRTNRSHEHPVRLCLSLIHISEPTRLGMISYAVFCLKKK